jgi:hypothetical protein
MSDETSLRMKLLLIFVSLGICFAAGEVGVGILRPGIRRYDNPDVSRSLPVTGSSYLPFTLPRGISFHHHEKEFDVTYRFNEFGYRGPTPVRIRKTPGSKRLLLCGDSFTMGWGVDQPHTFAQIIADSLASTRYEVINAGFHDAYAPDTYYAYLRKEGIPLKPDLVVILVFSDNDIQDLCSSIWMTTDSLGAPTKVFSTRVYSDYHGRSCHPLAWYYRVPVLRESRLFVAAGRVYDHIWIALNAGSKKEKITRRTNLPEETGWHRFRVCTGAICRLGSLDGFRTAFVVIPPEPGKRPHAGPEAYQHVVTTLREVAPGRVLGLAPVVNAGDYYPADGHFNAKGSRAAALAILEFLRSHKLLAMS